MKHGNVASGLPWAQADWPDEKIKDFGDRLGSIIPGVKWNWDPAYTQPRFRAFVEGTEWARPQWVLVLYVDGIWWLDRNGTTVAKAETAPVSFEAGARELLGLYRARSGR